MVRALLLTLGGLLLFIAVFHYLFPVRLWLAARNLGMRVSFFDMLRLANNPSKGPRKVLEALVMAGRLGVDLEFEDVFDYAGVHYHDLDLLVRGVKTAREQGTDLPVSHIGQILEMADEQPEEINYRLHQGTLQVDFKTEVSSRDKVKLMVQGSLAVEIDGFDFPEHMPECDWELVVQALGAGAAESWAANLVADPLDLANRVKAMEVDSGQSFSLIELEIYRIEASPVASEAEA